MTEFVAAHKFSLFLAIIILLILAAVFFLESILTDSNAQRISALATVVGSIGSIVVLAFLSYQSLKLRDSINLQAESTRLQTESFNLEQRPYLWLDMHSNMSKGDPPDVKKIFGGGYLFFRNEGKIPANIVDAQYLIASDVNKNIDLVKWFESARGSFPQIKTIFPNQKDNYVFLNPIIGDIDNKPKLLFISALIKYTGKDSQKFYWYKFTRLIEIAEFDPEKNAGRISTILIDDDWDRDSPSNPSSLKYPDWDKYLPLFQEKPKSEPPVNTLGSLPEGQ